MKTTSAAAQATKYSFSHTCTNETAHETQARMANSEEVSLEQFLGLVPSETLKDLKDALGYEVSSYHVGGGVAYVDVQAIDYIFKPSKTSQSAPTFIAMTEDGEMAELTASEVEHMVDFYNKNAGNSPISADDALDASRDVSWTPRNDVYEFAIERSLEFRI